MLCWVQIKMECRFHHVSWLNSNKQTLSNARLHIQSFNVWTKNKHRVQAVEIHQPSCPAVCLNDRFGWKKALWKMCLRCCTLGSQGQPRCTALPKMGSGTKLIWHMTSPTGLSLGRCNSIMGRPLMFPEPRQLLGPFKHVSKRICFSVPFAFCLSVLSLMARLLLYSLTLILTLQQGFAILFFFHVVWQDCLCSNCNLIRTNQRSTWAVVHK